MSAQPSHVAAGELYERESLLAEVGKELKALWRYRGLLRHLVKSSLATESTGTVFGSLWWLLDPLILMGVYVVFVDVILRAGGEDYALFVFIGLVAWKHFSSSVTYSITGTLRREQLMRQVAFPKSVLPLAAGIAGTIHFFIALGMFVLIAVPFGLAPDPIMLVVVVPIAVQVVLMLGTAYLLSSLNIFFRDIQNLSGYAFRLLLFLSPALYTIERIPDGLRPYYNANPFATIFPAYHAILLDHRLPDFRALAIVGAVSVAVLIAGFVTFVRLEHAFTKVS